MNDTQRSNGTADEPSPATGSAPPSARTSLAEELLRVVKLLGIVAATVVVAVAAARLVQAFLTALGLGFG